MSGRHTIRCGPLLALAAGGVAVLLMGTSSSKAGILVPQQISFDVKDLEHSLNDSHASGSSSTPHNSQQWPPQNDEDEQPGPLGRLKSALPAGHSSSSSSSSSGGAP